MLIIPTAKSSPPHRDHPTLLPKVVIVQVTFPSTRYQGSKAKIVDWIANTLSDYPVHSVLDAFGGSGVVAHKFKQLGKEVTYNDILPFNHQFGIALIQNTSVILDEQDVAFLFARHNHVSYGSVIQNHFSGIYFTDDENRWLDQTICNLRQFACPYRHALAFFALAQACLIKRPFNLFHRNNLYLRLAEVRRRFGNKTSWDKPFETWMNTFITEANQAVFAGSHPCVSVCHDAAQVPGQFDLVYADPPYISSNGTPCNYADFYHFLTGICQYDQWEEQIDFNSKHRRLKQSENVWNQKTTIHKAFDEFMGAYPGSVLAISYRNNGIPSPEEMQTLLLRHRSTVIVHDYGYHQYALSKNKKTRELLFVGR